MCKRNFKKIVILSLCTLILLSCKREHTNPLDPQNPNSNAVALPPPTGLTAIPDYEFVTLTWDTVDNAVKYHVYRDDNQISVVESTSYKDEGLSAGKEYKYQVASVHSSGLCGHKSNPVYTKTKGVRIEYSKYVIYSDDNNNGVINPGETISMYIYLKNTGTETATDIKAHFSVNDSYISIHSSNDSAHYPIIEPNNDSKGNEYYKFGVSSGCPNGHVVTFYLDISDNSGNSWADTFTITVLEYIGTWHKSEVDSSGYNYEGIEIGVGRDDNQIRLYTSDRNVYIYELTWNGSFWDNVTIGKVGTYKLDITIGNGRNDGIMRVYAVDAEAGSSFTEFTWNGASWDKAYNGGGSSTHRITVGNGRNDGVMRVYGGSGYSWGIYEFTWNGSDWDEVVVGSGIAEPQDIVIGCGRNDGVMRVYEASGDHHIYEFSWNGSSWNKVDVGSGTSDMQDIAIGPGRNDGVMRVYGANQDKHICEFTWNGSFWAVEDVGSGDNYMEGVAVGNGRNDGVIRVYGGNEDKYIYEFTWNGNIWGKSSSINTDGQVSCVSVGAGRNDNVTRVYGLTRRSAVSKHIIEFTFW